MLIDQPPFNNQFLGTAQIKGGLELSRGIRDFSVGTVIDDTYATKPLRGQAKG